MPDLFSSFRLKAVTLRNRIGMSPMTMYRSKDGLVDDYHVMYLGGRAAGGFGLVFPEQIAISPEGRTCIGCAGIYGDAQVEGLSRVTAMIKRMGAVPAIQLGHTGHRGSMTRPWEGGVQLPADHRDGWQVVGPSAIPSGGPFTQSVHPLTREEIRQVHRQYARAAQRALEAGFEWLELHFAHGYLGSTFFSPLTNKRTDEYGGSLENRLRFHLEALVAVREVWPEGLPLTVRLATDEFDDNGINVEDAVFAIGKMKERGLDLADLSMSSNSKTPTRQPFKDASFMVAHAAQVKREVGIPVATSWNLGVPAEADRVIREGKVDVVLLGRPALANAHWPVWAARELGHPDPFSLLPQDWGWWLTNFRGHDASIGWPSVASRKILSESAVSELPRTR